jgi:hypothetical protein
MKKLVKITFYFLIHAVLFQTKTISEKDAFCLTQEIISIKNIEKLYLYLFKEYRNFFFINPEEYIPVTESSLCDFVIIADPLLRFFEALLLEDIFLPIPTTPQQEVITNLFNPDYLEKSETLHDALCSDTRNIIYLPLCSYEDLLEKIVFIKKIYQEISPENRQNKKLFIQILPENAFIKSKKDITEIITDIKKILGSTIPNQILSELKKTSIKSEYDAIVTLIYILFPDDTVSIFSGQETPNIMEFIEFLDDNNIEHNTVTIIDTSDLIYYSKGEYELEKKENHDFPHASKCYFYKIENTNKNSRDNIEKQNSKKIMIVFRILDMITGAIDE